jgi:hypothetical protein
MLRINLYGNLQEMKMPNRSGRASALNGQLPLDRAAYATKQSVVGALVRTALARQGETEPQSQQWNHMDPNREMSFARIGIFPLFRRLPLVPEASRDAQSRRPVHVPCNYACAWLA